LELVREIGGHREAFHGCQADIAVPAIVDAADAHRQALAEDDAIDCAGEPRLLTMARPPGVRETVGGVDWPGAMSCQAIA